MKIIRFIFAPFFWLREIKNSVAQIERLRRWEYCLHVRHSSLSTKGKKMLLTAMLHSKAKGKEISAASEISAADILRALELED